MSEAETVPAEVTVEDVWAEEDGRGRLAGMARVVVTIGGVEIRISGIRITRGRGQDSRLYAELPCHPSASRGWNRAVELPEAVEYAIGQMVCGAARLAGIQ